MRHLFILGIVVAVVTTTCYAIVSIPIGISDSIQTKDLPAKNKAIVDYVVHNGKTIAPTYEQAVCTELVIGVLKHFIPLQTKDKNRIRIICKENVHDLRRQGSSIPKGVYYALTKNRTGTGITKLEDVLPGDFVQFWYWSWGHCGIVKSINIEQHSMELYSSFPSTNGYGIQTFNIPKECYFVRLN